MSDPTDFQLLEIGRRAKNINASAMRVVFDVGRASRDAEVAEAVARAEAAEAVIERVAQARRENAFDGEHFYGTALVDVALSTIPQTTLAEREEYGDPYSCADLGHEDCGGTHPDHAPAVSHPEPTETTKQGDEK